MVLSHLPWEQEPFHWFQSIFGLCQQWLNVFLLQNFHVLKFIPNFYLFFSAAVVSGIFSPNTSDWLFVLIVADGFCILIFRSATFRKFFYCLFQFDGWVPGFSDVLSCHCRIPVFHCILSSYYTSNCFLFWIESPNTLHRSCGVLTLVAVALGWGVNVCVVLIVLVFSVAAIKQEI